MQICICVHVAIVDLVGVVIVGVVVVVIVVVALHGLCAKGEEQGW